MTPMTTQTPASIMKLADNMAAAAATFNSHGYDQFIEARATLEQTLNEMARSPEPILFV